MARPGEDAKWLLLIHQLPPKPDYIRVKIRRRLHKIGAVAVKNSVYALPNIEAAVEDFQWLVAEIRRDGGEGIVCKAVFVEGLSDEEVVQLFNKDRDAAYADIAARGRELIKRLRGRTISNDTRTQCESARTRLKRTTEAIVAQDFFGALGQAGAIETLSRVENLLTAPRQPSKARTQRAARLKGRTWVTRANVFVDRMASAWLIKRFIDPRARFKFVDAAKHRPSERELRFDMFDGEYTHRGGQCTFEVLLDDFGLREPALIELAQVIHDIDLKDDKFERPEAAGVALSLRGIRVKCSTDDERIAAGYLFFDGLYEAIKSGPRE